MSERFKYIFGKFASPAKNLTDGYQVQKVDYNVQIEYKDDNINIYDSLEQLVENDKLFASLNNKMQKDLIKKENIVHIKGFIIYDKNKIDTDNIAEFLQHTLFGDVYNGKALGVHHKSGLKDGVAEIIKVTKLPDKNGVYEAEIKRKDGPFFQKQIC